MFLLSVCFMSDFFQCLARSLWVLAQSPALFVSHHPHGLVKPLCSSSHYHHLTEQRGASPPGNCPSWKITNYDSRIIGMAGQMVGTV